MNNPTTRRTTLKQLTLGAVGTLAAGQNLWAAPSETLRIGCIGTGGRLRRLMSKVTEIPGTKIVAVCDVWDHHLAEAKKLADPSAFATKDYHALLAHSDVDAVMIGTPDHWHVPMTIDACAAGKDVYVEKPLTHDLAEGQAVIDAQNNHRRIVQVGMQQRSMPHLIKAREIIKSGQIGKVCKVHLTWNRNNPRGKQTDYGIDPATVDWKRFLGNAPDQPFDDYRFRQWRWFWDFGGGIFTDLMVHWIDVVHWVLDLDQPQMAVSIGDHFQSAGLWETPDTVQTLLSYPDGGPQVYFEGTFVNARNRAMMEYMGTDATLYADRGRYEIHPERNRRIEASQLILGAGERGADFYDNPDGERLHLINWVECVRSRKTPNAPVEAGVQAAAAAHMANQALRGAMVAKRG